MKCFNKFTLLIVFFLASGSAQSSPGEIKTSQKTKFHYKLGGSPIVQPSGYGTKINLGVRMKGSAGLGYSCGQFDPFASITDGLNNLKNGAQDAAINVVGAATGAVASLPMYILTRANPDLAGLLQEYTYEFKQNFEVDLLSCQEREAAILSGDGNPFGDLVKLSKQATLVGEQKSGEANINAATKKAEEKGGCIKGVGGQQVACEGKPPLDITNDLAGAGYSILVHGSAGSSVSAASGSQLKEVLGTPDEAKDFAVRVLGTASFANLDTGETPETTPPIGLSEEIKLVVDNISPLINRYVSATGAPLMQEEYDQLATGSINLKSAELQNAIKSFNTASMRNFIGEKLKWEIATAITLEKALMLKSLIKAGMREPNLYALGNVQIEAEKMLSQLDGEMDDVLRDLEIREKTTSSTALKVLEFYEESGARRL